VIREIQKEIEVFLSKDKEYTNNQIFLLLAQKSGFKTGQEICNAMWRNELGFSFESVTRAIRKAREERPELRDLGYKGRKEKSEPKVRQEMKSDYSDFHTQKIGQGSLF